MDEIEINGVIRDLRHLRNFVVTVPGKGKNNGDLRVRVSLGLHTISKSCKKGDHNLEDENGKPRQFCEDRYAFSLKLPELSKRMVENNYHCWISEDKNRGMNFALIDEKAGLVREDGEYHVVFFYTYPYKGQDADVSLFITSCYRRDVYFANIKRRYNTHTILRECLFKGKRVPS